MHGNSIFDWSFYVQILVGKLNFDGQKHFFLMFGRHDSNIFRSGLLLVFCFTKYLGSLILKLFPERKPQLNQFVEK